MAEGAIAAEKRSLRSPEAPEESLTVLPVSLKNPPRGFSSAPSAAARLGRRPGLRTGCRLSGRRTRRASFHGKGPDQVHHVGFILVHGAFLSDGEHEGDALALSRHEDNADENFRPVGCPRTAEFDRLDAVQVKFGAVIEFEIGHDLAGAPGADDYHG